jgi:hypothetical protein
MVKCLKPKHQIQIIFFLKYTIKCFAPDLISAQVLAQLADIPSTTQHILFSQKTMKLAPIFLQT